MKTDKEFNRSKSEVRWIDIFTAIRARARTVRKIKIDLKYLTKPNIQNLRFIVVSVQLSLSRREFARLCGVSHTHINNLIREGKLSLDEYGIPVPQAFFEFEKVTGRKLSPELTGAYFDSDDSIIEKIDPFLRELDLLPERLATMLHVCETVEEVQSMLDDALQGLIAEHIESLDD